MTPNTRPSLRPRHRALLTTAAVSLAFLTGCTQPAALETGNETDPPGPISHIHSISVDPDSGHLILAAHEGLFEVTPEQVEKIGPTIDLMGFTPTENGTYYASGHPGPGTDLPDPVGLIRSTNRGETWQAVSLEGESDFHALTITGNGLLGYDGTLKSTTDYNEWTTIGAAIQPHTLAGTAGSPVVLATTEQGIQRSEDNGQTWTKPADSPVLLLAAFADDTTAAGVAPDGTAYISDDAGKSWQPTGGTVTGTPAALAAETAANGVATFWVATSTAVEYSEDGGATFTHRGLGLN